MGEIKNSIPFLITESGTQLRLFSFDGDDRIYVGKYSDKLNSHIRDVAFDNESEAYAKLAQYKVRSILPVKTIIYGGRKWLIMPKAQGKCLLNEIDSSDAINRKITERLLFRYLSDLSNIKSSYFGSLTSSGPKFTSEKELLKYMLDCRAHILRNSYNELYDVLDILEQRGAYTQTPNVVHYDLWPGNIFYNDKTKEIVVIDHERCLYTDKCAEGASLLGMIDSKTLEEMLCEGKKEIIAKMYLYRIIFLLERLEISSINAISSELNRALAQARKMLKKIISIGEKNERYNSRI